MPFLEILDICAGQQPVAKLVGCRLRSYTNHGLGHAFLSNHLSVDAMGQVCHYQFHLFSSLDDCL